MRVPLVGASTDRVAQAVSAGWNVEHAPDGRHAWQVVTPAFSAARFQGDGTITWTVDPADRAVESYQRLGAMVLYTLVLATTSTGGTASSTLYVTLPDRLIVARDTYAALARAIDNGTATTGMVYAQGGRNRLSVFRSSGNWSNASTNATYVYFQLFFEVQ